MDAATEEESQQLLQLFIQHIKVCTWFHFCSRYIHIFQNAKVVQLEELAAEFNLRTQV